MAFVLPAGDYERALRMAGASNFMEALEAGIDRGMQRQAMRERAARARDLYNRQVASQQADLMGDLLEIDSAGFTAGQPTVAAPATGQAVAVSPTTGQVIAAEGASVAAAPPAAAPSPTAAALADAVAAAPASVAPAQAPQTPIPESTLPSHQARVESRIKSLQDAWVATQDIAKRIEIEDELKELLIGQKQLAWYETEDLAKRQQLEEEIYRLMPRLRPEHEAIRGRMESLRGPGPFPATRTDPVQAPLDAQTEARANALRAEERVREGAPGAGQQLSEALSALAQTDPNVLAARQALADAVQAKEDFVNRLRSRGQTFISGMQTASHRVRIAEAERNLAEAVASAGSVPVPSSVTGQFTFPIRDTSEDYNPRLDEVGQGALPEEAPAAPAEGGDGVVGLPTGGPGSFATQAAGVTAALSDDPVLAAVRALQASAGQKAAPKWGQPGGPSLSEAYPYAQAMAGGGALPGAGEMAGQSTADEEMSDAVRGEPVKEEAAPPLQDAVSKVTAVAEEVELAGPEPEAVKADQTVDVAGKAYTVKKGDTLGRASSSFGAPLASVVAANQDVLAPGGKPRQIKRGGKVVLEGQDLIYAGDRIRIPTGEGRETGGEAGPVDPRPVTTVTGPGGQVTSSEGVLARVQRANKTNAQVKAALEKEQRKTPDLPLNPFQKFGRAIDYTPSLKAVAFATLRAQQGDFTMLNQLAGRQVRNSEIPGLFAEYSEFVRGAKGRAKEVYLQQELLKETQANEAKLRALTGVKAMALTQFRRAGYTDEDAQVFAGHYADLYAADPQQARAWSTSLNSMGTDRAKAEAARLKRSGFRSKTGLSRKDLMALRKERRAIKKDRAAIAGKMESAIRDAQLVGDDEVNRVMNSLPYQLLLKEYSDSDAMLAEINADLGYTEDTDDDDDGPKDYVKSTIANQSVIALAKNFSGDMDSFESGIERRLKAAGDPKSAENAKLVREHFEKSQAEQAQFVSALPRGGADILGEEGLPEFRKARLASLPGVEKRVENLLNRVKELRVSAARGSSSQRGDVMDELRDIADKIDRDRAEIKDITGKDPGDIARPARTLLRRISLAERPTDRAAFEGGF